MSSTFKWLFLIISFIEFSFAQEIIWQGGGERLLPLLSNPELSCCQTEPLKNNIQYYYLADTVALPFVDDFSADFFKIYEPSLYEIWGDSVACSFRIFDSCYNSILYSPDTTWEYHYDANGTLIDSVVLPWYPMVTYDDSEFVFNPTDTVFIWPPFNVYDTAGGIPDTVILQSALVLTNDIDTLTLLKDGRYSLWVDRKAYRNLTLASDPPTIGIASLDGLNQSGKAYNYDVPDAWGIADYLTSKLIDLTYFPGDSVYLSFYYQPEGLGNDPQPEDSLVLEFYSPVLRTWKHIWSTPGDTLKPFRQVMIGITDTIFLKDGFRFRFKNYATLSGAFDHWHIDYVRLATNRSATDTLINNDAAFTTDYPSLIKNYTSMPWTHYKNDTLDNMSDTIAAGVSNLGSMVLNLTDFSYSIKNQAGTAYNFTSNSHNLDPFTDSLIVHQLNYTCWYSDDDSAVFYISKNIAISGSVDVNGWNDTIRSVQKFYDFYSYDDGTAEGAYALFNYYGARLAMRFTIDTVDTIRAVMISFIQALKDVSDLKFRLTVWGGNTEPGFELSKNSDYDKPEFPDGVNKFYTYMLETPVAVTGTFFIGFEQLTEQPVTVGYDLNRNSNANVLYEVGSGWTNSILNGTLLIRPVFGKAAAEGASISENSNGMIHPVVRVYPVPADITLNIFFSPGNHSGFRQEKFYFKMYDLAGRPVSSMVLFRGINTIGTAHLPGGLYHYQIFSDNRFIDTGKIVIE